jgi:NAD-dependent SIR2 family protein deacetylase
LDTEAAKLARLIVENQPCVALTGAGVSTESFQSSRTSATT